MMLSTILFLLLFCTFPTAISAQHISVDSLERNGYHVRIYRPHPKARTVIKEVHDTMFLPIVRVIILHDTLFREQIYYYSIEKQSPEKQIVKTDAENLHTLLIGNANTNGYGMHLGMMLSLGERISFFIGGGMGYNSVTKITHLDLAGQLLIRVW